MNPLKAPKKQKVKPFSVKRGIIRSLLLLLPMLFLTFMMTGRGSLPSEPTRLFVLIVTLVFFNLLFFLMLRTGRTDRYRAVLFITLAVTFVISFISNLIEIRGSPMVSGANMIEGEVPFCHLVIPMTLIPAALTKTIIFPGSILKGFASIASMFVIWIGVSLALGRGFCSWFCFFGGLDEGFSRILKKPVIKKVDPKWTYLPIAVLLVVVILAAATLSPIYCQWLCPFKTVTEFAEITSLRTLIQAVIFVSLFIVLVVALPLLMKRRAQCGLFCPFGPFQSLTNRINAFEVRVDRETCVKCNKCVSTCPTFSITEEGIAAGKVGMSCMKCGKCIDACPTKALMYHVKGTALPGKRELHRLLFIYPAFLVLAIISSDYIQDAIIRIIRLITTGSLLA